MHDIFGRQIVGLDDWKKEAQAGRGATDVALIKSYAGVFDVAKAEGESAAQIRIRITTGARDRDRDSIAPSGWDVSDFLKNPVVLFAHNYREFPVGKDIGLTIDANGIVGTPVFTSAEENPRGDMCGRLIRGGFLNAASIGMTPLEWTYNEEARGFDFKRQLLLEYSIVPVPANAEALTIARSQGINLDPMKAWAEEFLDTWHGEPVLSLPRKSAERAMKFLTGNPISISLPKGITAALTGDNADDLKAARETIEAALKDSPAPVPNAAPAPVSEVPAPAPDAKTAAPLPSEPTDPPNEDRVFTFAADDEPEEPTFSFDPDLLRSLVRESADKAVGELIAAHTGRLD